MLKRIKMDAKKILKMDANEQKKEMTETFTKMLKGDKNEMTKQLYALLKDVQKEGTDEEYVKLCKTNVSIAGSLDEKTLKIFMDARLKANKQLDSAGQSRDMKNLTKAMEGSPYKDKIMAAISGK